MSTFRALMHYSSIIIAAPAMVIMAGPAFAAVYLNLSEAQQIIFPGESFTEVTIQLSEDQIKALSDKIDFNSLSNRFQIWHTSLGGYFIVDEVIGKHEFITYAVGINSDGSIRQVEIMQYREAYGSEIRQKKWRRQFVGKTIQSPLQLNSDIKNISGATLSCRHVTEGVKSVIAFYDLILKK